MPIFLMESTRVHQLEILLIEDDDSDIFFVERATRACRFVRSFHVTRNGLDAIKYLRGEPPYSDRTIHPMPNMILTDIKMPLMGGFDFLRWLQAHNECKIIPVMVYSSSKMESDVKLAYELGANAYYHKPSEMKEMLEFLQFAYDFWSRCQSPVIPGTC